MEMLQQISAVVAVLALLGGALWMLRRGGLAGVRVLAKEGRTLESVERLSLTPQHSLHLVKIQGRAVLVATHPQGCALLLETPEGAGR